MHLGVTVILIPQHPNLFARGHACSETTHVAFDHVAFILCMQVV